MNTLKACVLMSCAAAVLAGCSTPPPPAPVVAPKPVAAAAPSAPKPVAASTVTPMVVPAYLDPTNPIASQRSVYFDFDQFSIKNEYVSLIERQGKYLASNPSLAVKIEGNADERGSAEYNLALGQKRAQAVVSALKIYGVKDTQMEAISWGKEKPKASGHDEAAWAQNRRADLAYPNR